MSATRPPAFDDRFSTPIEASRRGAHRARPKAVSAGLPVLAGVGVVLLVMGGGYVMLKGNGGSGSNSNLAGAGAVEDNPAPGKSKNAAAGGVQPTTPPSAEGDAPKSEDKEAGAPAAKVDKDLTLKVLNSGNVAGLARRTGSKLEKKGWSVNDGSRNSRERGLATTKIYYGKASAKATAKALQEDIGFGKLVRNSSVAGSGLVVVLGRDAE
jgi:LytR cell envelope-related transcriptional attenuator